MVMTRFGKFIWKYESCEYEMKSDTTENLSQLW